MMKIRLSSLLLVLSALLLLGGCALEPAYRYNANAGGGYYYGQSPYGNADTVIMGSYAQPWGWGRWSPWGAPYMRGFGFGPWGAYGNFYWGRYGGYYGNRYYRTYGHAERGTSQPAKPVHRRRSQPSRATHTNNNPTIQRIPPVGVIGHRPRTVLRQAPVRSSPDPQRAPVTPAGPPHRVR